MLLSLWWGPRWQWWCAAAITKFTPSPLLVLVNIWHFWSQYEVMSTYGRNYILTYPPIPAVLSYGIE